MEERIDYLVRWLQDKVEEAGADGALVGISGGIDSAVVSYLVKKAFPDQSLGVLLPINKKMEEQTDALAVVEGADLDYIGINLTDAYETTYKAVKGQIEEKGDWKDDKSQLGGANLKARLRMSTLYAVGNNYNYLVVGTDNAAEDYTGYFTKYGDGGVDLVPLINLRKEEVREMAGALDVPSSIIEKKPSAELWEGQTDEDELGMSYDTIDAYLRGEKINPEDEKKLKDRHEQTAHKRQIPAGPEEYRGD